MAAGANARVGKVDPGGTITFFEVNVPPIASGVGAPVTNGNGDGGPAVNASFGSVNDVAFDAIGNLYIADGANIRKISPGGTITTFASLIYNPVEAVAVDPTGNVYGSFRGEGATRAGGLDLVTPEGVIIFPPVGHFFDPG